MMITVLLSTYNGAKYLREQIDSILNQEGMELQLIVRDDGSIDSTRTILEEYSNQELLSWYEGENLGPTGSFFDLLEHAPDSDYYAFSDQDDVWLKDKLAMAVESLNNDMQPAIYASQTQMVDASLNDIQTPALTPLLSCGEALVYAFVTGCTVVINRKLRDIIIEHQPPKFILHDQWIYTVATAIGATIHFDNNSHILYRQHGNNVVGLNKSPLQLFIERIKRIVIDKPHIRSNAAIQLYKEYSHIMPSDSKQVVEQFIKGKTNLLVRLRLLTDNRYKCGNKKTEWLFKLAVLFNTY